MYEVDTQVLLSKHLESEFSEPHELKSQIETNNGLTFDIGKVHREYPRYKLTKPVDNVVFGEPRYWTDEELRNNSVYENFYEQPIKYAIELKFVYLNEVRNDRLDVAIGDYTRFIDDKLPILKEKFDFEYGLQLTLFQSAFEHDHRFLNYLDEAKWKTHYDEKKAKYYDPNKELFGFYYINLNTKKIEPIWN